MYVPSIGIPFIERGMTILNTGSFNRQRKKKADTEHLEPWNAWRIIPVRPGKTHRKVARFRQLESWCFGVSSWNFPTFHGCEPQVAALKLTGIFFVTKHIKHCLFVDQ